MKLKDGLAVAKVDELVNMNCYLSCYPNNELKPGMPFDHNEDQFRVSDCIGRQQITKVDPQSVQNDDSPQLEWLTGRSLLQIPY